VRVTVRARSPLGTSGLAREVTLKAPPATRPPATP
jgi:hypothetical protein